MNDFRIVCKHQLLIQRLEGQIDEHNEEHIENIEEHIEEHNELEEQHMKH